MCSKHRTILKMKMNTCLSIDVVVLMAPADVAGNSKIYFTIPSTCHLTLLQIHKKTKYRNSKWHRNSKLTLCGCVCVYIQVL